MDREVLKKNEKYSKLNSCHKVGSEFLPDKRFAGMGRDSRAGLDLTDEE